MSHLRLVTDPPEPQSLNAWRDRDQVWVCGGIDKPWRVASWSHDFGEFDQLEDAEELLRLLLVGGKHRPLT